jgi:hypothetical protein
MHSQQDASVSAICPYNLIGTQLEHSGNLPNPDEKYWTLLREHVNPLHWPHENYGSRLFQSRLIALPNSMGTYFHRCSN